MPEIRAEGGELYLADGNCKIKIRGDLAVIVDFERVFAIMSEDARKSLSGNGSTQHCDAITIRPEGEEVVVSLYELSMSVEREVSDYVRKFALCAGFVRRLLEIMRPRGRVKFKLFIVANPEAVGNLRDKIKNSITHFRRDVYGPYNPDPEVICCK